MLLIVHSELISIYIMATCIRRYFARFRTSIVFSRPTTKVSQDPEDGALTPNHVLILTSNAPEDAAQLCTGTALRGKVKRLRAYLDSFWDKWSREYLLEQQRRSVWDRSRKDFRVGELVVVQELSLIHI